MLDQHHALAKKLWLFLALWWGLGGMATGAVWTTPQDSFQNTFSKYSGLVSGVDFFAATKASVTPLVEPVEQGLTRLKLLLGNDLPAGAVVVCNSSAERDSVSEERVLKLGYKWVLVEMSPQAEMDQRLQQLRARMGDEISPEMMQRIMGSTTPEQIRIQLARSAAAMVPNVSFAVVSTLLAPEKRFRISRVEDVSRSPLADWLDLGLASFAADNSSASLRWTQTHLEEVFPIEDLLDMNRPFVLPESMGGPSINTGGGGMRMIVGRGANPTMGGMVGGSAGGDTTPGGGQFVIRQGGGEGGRGEGRRGGGTQLPKEVQDRLNFDHQASLFFAYLVEKIGTEKTRTLIRKNLEGAYLMTILETTDYFGKPIEDIEQDWIEWTKVQTVPEVRGEFRMRPRPDQPPW